MQWDNATKLSRPINHNRDGERAMLFFPQYLLLIIKNFSSFSSPSLFFIFFSSITTRRTLQIISFLVASSATWHSIPKKIFLLLLLQNYAGKKRRKKENGKIPLEGIKKFTKTIYVFIKNVENLSSIYHCCHNISGYGNNAMKIRSASF